MSTDGRQSGASLLVVLVVLASASLAALAAARMSLTSTLVVGSLAARAGALQVSDAGLAEAFKKLQDLPTNNLNENAGNWYFALRQDEDSEGIPKDVDWTKAPYVSIGGYTASYVVERLCGGSLPVSDIAGQCLSRRIEKNFHIEVYRATVRVQGTKGAQTFVQSLAQRGS